MGPDARRGAPRPRPCGRGDRADPAARRDPDPLGDVLPDGAGALKAGTAARPAGAVRRARREAGPGRRGPRARAGGLDTAGVTAGPGSAVARDGAAAAA